MVMTIGGTAPLKLGAGVKVQLPFCGHAERADADDGGAAGREAVAAEAEGGATASAGRRRRRRCRARCRWRSCLRRAWRRRAASPARRTDTVTTALAGAEVRPGRRWGEGYRDVAAEVVVGHEHRVRGLGRRERAARRHRRHAVGEVERAVGGRLVTVTATTPFRRRRRRPGARRSACVAAAAARARGLPQVVDGHHGQRPPPAPSGAAVVGDGERMVWSPWKNRRPGDRCSDAACSGRDRLADRDRCDAVGEPRACRPRAGGDGDADDAAVDVGAREADQRAVPRYRWRCPASPPGRRSAG